MDAAYFVELKSFFSLTFFFYFYFLNVFLLILIPYFQLEPILFKFFLATTSFFFYHIYYIKAKVNALFNWLVRMFHILQRLQI